MKARILYWILLILVFLTGCVVYSFYPLYTEKDLFVNDLLLGTWTDDDDTKWKFEYLPVYKDNQPATFDSITYRLSIKEKSVQNDERTMVVRVIMLEDQYFLDFYLEDFGDNDSFNFFDLHTIPVHTFAKVNFFKNRIEIRWFDPDWLEDLMTQNKIRIHHENNNDFILLTAKPRELQKFVSKYVNSEDAFKDGFSVDLFRN